MEGVVGGLECCLVKAGNQPIIRSTCGLLRWARSSDDAAVISAPEACIFAFSIVVEQVNVCMKWPDSDQ